MIIRGTVTEGKLNHIYKTVQNLFKDNSQIFYTSQEIENLKKDSNNIFICKGGE
jgi:ABC-type sugar transport system ATPase subunit